MNSPSQLKATTVMDIKSLVTIFYLDCVKQILCVYVKLG